MRRCVHLALVLTSCLFSGTMLADEMVIVRDGVPRASVVLPAPPTEYELLAQKELLDHVRRMTGAELRSRQILNDVATQFNGMFIMKSKVIGHA